jgi:hypothetical protein
VGAVRQYRPTPRGDLRSLAGARPQQQAVVDIFVAGTVFYGSIQEIGIEIIRWLLR